MNELELVSLVEYLTDEEYFNIYKDHPYNTDELPKKMECWHEPERYMVKKRFTKGKTEVTVICPPCGMQLRKFEL